MLVAAVVLGVVLGPAVLGRLAPQVYDPMFVGSGDMTEADAAEAELDKFLNDADTRKALIDQVIADYELVGEEGDSITTARDEQLLALNNRFADEREKLQDAVMVAMGEVTIRREAHREKLLNMATALLLLIVLLFAAEAILSPQRDEIEQGRAVMPPVLSRLITVRYGLASGWLLLMLAQPVWLRGIDLVFGVLLLAVVVVAGLVPLGKKA